MKNAITGSSLFLTLSMVTLSCQGTEPEEDVGSSHRVGAIMPVTGPLAGAAVMLEQSIRVAMDEINSAGGINGSKVELTVKDSKGEAEAGKTAAQDLVDEGVETVFGAVISGVTSQVLDVTVPAEVLVLNGASTAMSLTTERDNDGLFLRTAPTVAAEGAAFADLIRADGHSKVAVIVAESDYTRGMADTFKTDFEAGSCGDDPCEVIELAFDPETPEEDMDYTGDIDDLLAENPDTFLVATYQEHGTAYLQAGTAAGYKNTWYVGEPLKRGEVVELLDANTRNRLKGVHQALLTGTADYDYYSNKYVGLFGEEPNNNRGAGSYDTMMLYALAAHSTQSSDARTIASAIRDISMPPGEVVKPGDYAKAIALLDEGKEIDYDGAAGTMDFDEQGDVEFTSIEIWKYADGDFQTVEVVTDQ